MGKNSISRQVTAHSIPGVACQSEPYHLYTPLQTQASQCQRISGGGWKQHDELQAFTRQEPMLRVAVEAFHAKVFCLGPNGNSRSLRQKKYRHPQVCSRMTSTFSRHLSVWISRTKCLKFASQSGAATWHSSQTEELSDIKHFDGQLVYFVLVRERSENSDVDRNRS